MKLLSTLTLIILSSICFGQNLSKDFGWIIGDWKRTNNKPGKITTESWKSVSDKELKGFGLTMVGQDTVFYEDIILRLAENDAIYFIVKTPEHQSSVTFQVMSYNKKYFTCENPDNDFPKVITYEKSKNGITATISAGEKKIDFDFVPKD